MEPQKFNILYSGEVRNDVISLCEYIDDFYADQGVDSVDINVPAVFGVIGAMTQAFPSPLGVEQASPFKKVAAFTTYFAAQRPIITGLPVELFGELATHQNSIVAYALSVDHRPDVFTELGVECRQPLRGVRVQSDEGNFLIVLPCPYAGSQCSDGFHLSARFSIPHISGVHLRPGVLVHVQSEHAFGEVLRLGWPDGVIISQWPDCPADLCADNGHVEDGVDVFFDVKPVHDVAEHGIRDSRMGVLCS